MPEADAQAVVAQPLFDDTREALVFALNAIEIQMPRPAMTKAMAQVEIKKRKPRKPRGKKALWLDDDAIQAELAREDAERRRMVRAAFARKRASLSPLDKAAQAGFILAELAKLLPHQQSVLTGRLMRSHRPCSCRAPCCSGHAINMRWQAAVSETCNLLKDGGYGPQQAAGRRGLSTQPALRRAVVEGYFVGSMPSLAYLASMAECSQVTAAKHRDWILQVLDAEERIAWHEIATLLDAAGITGAFTD